MRPGRDNRQAIPYGGAAPRTLDQSRGDRDTPLRPHVGSTSEARQRSPARPEGDDADAHPVIAVLSGSILARAKPSDALRAQWSGCKA